METKQIQFNDRALLDEVQIHLAKRKLGRRFDWTGVKLRWVVERYGTWFRVVCDVELGRRSEFSITVFLTDRQVHRTVNAALRKSHPGIFADFPVGWISRIFIPRGDRYGEIRVWAEGAK